MKPSSHLPPKLVYRHHHVITGLFLVVVVFGLASFFPEAGQAQSSSGPNTSPNHEQGRDARKSAWQNKARQQAKRASAASLQQEGTASPAAGTAPTAVDDLWDDRFSPPGVTCCAGFNSASVVKVVGSDVYVGGEFTEVGYTDGTPAIARWNGRSWSSLGGGLTTDGGSRAGSVYDIAISGENIYVAGYFEMAGKTLANGVARWNTRTQTWYTVGNGDGPQDADGDATSASSISVIGGQVYLGGSFARVDGVDASGIAMWDGKRWSSLAGGVATDSSVDDPAVYAIAGIGDLVYVGGTFEIAVNPSGVADAQANNIAVWNRRTHRWSSLGVGTTGEVDALLMNGSSLYVGGAFLKAGNLTVNRIARWDGSKWSALRGGASDVVVSFAFSQGTLYAAGWFGSMDHVANTNSLAAWNGTTWRSARSDLLFSDPSEDYINGVGVLANGHLFVGGVFNDYGHPLVTNLAYWDGARWRGTGLGFEDGSTAYVGGDSYAVVVNAQGQVFAGGEFEEIGGLPFSHIAMWDGTNWHDVGGGVNGDISTMLIRGDDLYVAGGFSIVGKNISAVRIAKWNMRTKTWSAVGSNLPGGYINALAFVGTTLYAGGGGFPGQEECCLWKFDGTTWKPFSERYLTNLFVGPFGAASSVYSLASDGQHLFIGGGFIDMRVRATGNRINTNEILTYTPQTDSIGVFGSGSTVGADNGSYPAYVTAIEFGADGVYIGGEFRSIAGKAAVNIAKLDANGWSGLGTGALGEEPSVNAIVAYGDDIYVGGSFETVTVEAYNVAKWSTRTNSWSSIGCGVTRNGDTISVGHVTDLAVQPSNLPNSGLYVTGGIVGAGCKASMGFAIWHGIGAPGGGSLNRHVFMPFVRK